MAYSIVGIDPTNITISGRIFSYLVSDTQEPNEDFTITQTVDRLLIGGQQCNHWNNDTETPYVNHFMFICTSSNIITSPVSKILQYHVMIIYTFVTEVVVNELRVNYMDRQIQNTLRVILDSKVK